MLIQAQEKINHVKAKKSKVLDLSYDSSQEEEQKL